MDAMALRPRMSVGERTVRQVLDTSEPVWAGRKIVGTRPVRAVTFTDGSRARYGLSDVLDASGYVEQFPSGEVASKLAGSATRVRANDGRWSGESGRLGDLRTRELDLISHTNMYDAGRVNGVVGAAR